MGGDSPTRWGDASEQCVTWWLVREDPCEPTRPHGCRWVRDVTEASRAHSLFCHPSVEKVPCAATRSPVAAGNVNKGLRARGFWPRVSAPQGRLQSAATALQLVAGVSRRRTPGAPVCAQARDGVVGQPVGRSMSSPPERQPVGEPGPNTKSETALHDSPSLNISRLGRVREHVGSPKPLFRSDRQDQALGLSGWVAKRGQVGAPGNLHDPHAAAANTWR